MSKRRMLIYLACIVAIILLIVMKQGVITAERNVKTISTFSEWQEKGKPVVVERVVKRNVDLYSKITVVQATGNYYEGYVPKTIQMKLRPGQSLYIEGEEKNVKGNIVEVGNEIDLDSGMFRVRISFENKENIINDVGIVYVNTGTLSDVICVPNDTVNQEGDDYVLWVAEKDCARKKTVTIEQRNGYGFIIAQGLSVGEMVIIEGFTQLLDNDKLNVLNIAKLKEF